MRSLRTDLTRFSQAKEHLWLRYVLLMGCLGTQGSFPHERNRLNSACPATMCFAASVKVFPGCVASTPPPGYFLCRAQSDTACGQYGGRAGKGKERSQGITPAGVTVFPEP